MFIALSAFAQARRRFAELAVANSRSGNVAWAKALEARREG